MEIFQLKTIYNSNIISNHFRISLNTKQDDILIHGTNMQKLSNWHHENSYKNKMKKYLGNTYAKVYLKYVSIIEL